MYHGRQYFTKDTLPQLFTAVREQYGDIAFFKLSEAIDAESCSGSKNSANSVLVTSASSSPAPTHVHFNSELTPSPGAPAPSASQSQSEDKVIDAAPKLNLKTSAHINAVGVSSTSSPAVEKGESRIDRRALGKTTVPEPLSHPAPQCKIRLRVTKKIGPDNSLFIPPPAVPSPLRADVSGAACSVAVPAPSPRRASDLEPGSLVLTSAMTTETYIDNATKAHVDAPSGSVAAAPPLRKPDIQNRPGPHSEQYRVVTINVDGCGSKPYKEIPATRMKKLVQKLLPLEPDAICVQEVTDELFEALRVLLPSWCTFRKKTHRGLCVKSWSPKFIPSPFPNALFYALGVPK